MLVKGIIKDLNKIVISDPNYEMNVHCRYDRTIEKIEDWKAMLKINYCDKLLDKDDENSRFKGLEYDIVLSKKDVKVKLKGNSLYSTTNMAVTTTEIGVDSAQIAFGVNENAAEINEHSKYINDDRLNVMTMLEEYNPYFAIQTGSDGYYGTVYEGKIDDEIKVIYMSGYLDDVATIDTEEDLKDYFVERLNITGIERKRENDYEMEM